jgi:hypothetical protein
MELEESLETPPPFPFSFPSAPLLLPSLEEAEE